MISRRILRKLFNGSALSFSRSTHRICLISDIYKSKREEGSTTIQGWVKALRIQKKNVFFDVNDGSCLEKMQVYLPKELAPPELSWGAAVHVAGELGLTPRGQLELRASSVNVRAPSAPEAGMPLLARHTCSLEDMRQNPHLRARTSSAAAMMRVRDAATRAFHSHLAKDNFLLIHTPILTSNDCEGAGETFRVEPAKEIVPVHNLKQTPQSYFGSETFLTVSGQLHLEAAAQGLGRVYTFGPTFRAENSKSRLHLSEFYMLEAEIPFVEDLETLKKLTESMVKDVTRTLLDSCGADIAHLREGSEVPDWFDKPFASFTLKEALSRLGDEAAGDLNKDQELRLVELTGRPTFVTHYPMSSKPFYARSCPEQPELALAVDLLVPLVGELLGGSVRENSESALRSRVPSGLDWYLQLRAFGGAPTAGYGLGFERYLQMLCNIPNIKDTIPFPRWPHNCPL